MIEPFAVDVPQAVLDGIGTSTQHTTHRQRNRDQGYGLEL
jgi:hypothetical protein